MHNKGITVEKEIVFHIDASQPLAGRNLKSDTDIIEIQ